jgi:hypothetical protein
LELTTNTVAEDGPVRARDVPVVLGNGGTGAKQVYAAADDFADSMEVASSISRLIVTVFDGRFGLRPIGSF